MEPTFRERVKSPRKEKHGRGAEDTAPEAFLRAIGGELLAGSGFEDEVPEDGYISDSDTAT